MTNFHQKHSMLKQTKNTPLKENILARGRKIDPLIVITIGAKAMAHISSLKLLEDNS